MLLILFSNSAAKLQTQSSSSFPWELHLLNLWWVRKHYYLPHCAPGKRGVEEKKLFCLFVLGSDLICSHQPNRYSFESDFLLWLPPWQAGIPQQEPIACLFHSKLVKDFLFQAQDCVLSVCSWIHNSSCLYTRAMCLLAGPFSKRWVHTC